MASKRLVTAAVRVLREHAVEYTEHHYDYTPGGGAVGGAALLDFDPHVVIKTLIMESGDNQPVCILMHGDRRVSTKSLARHLEVKSVALCTADRAQKYSGYLLGGTSPFGLRTQMVICCEASIPPLEWIVVNGGKRGFLIELRTDDLIRILQPQLVEVAT